MQMKKINEISFNVRIPEELNEKIKKISEEENRSKNQQIEYILKEYVKKYETEKSSISINQIQNTNANVNISK